MVISTIEMTAVTDSVNPASFALPSTRSVNSVENTAVGASDSITAVFRTDASNGRRNQQAAANSTPSGKRQPSTRSTLPTSLPVRGKSISMPTMNTEQNEFASATGCSRVGTNVGM